MNTKANSRVHRAEPQLQEGEDFYWESGFMVLTARYLAKRGYCCGNGCRHCPYKESTSRKSENHKSAAFDLQPSDI